MSKISGDPSIFKEIESKTPDEASKFFSSLSLADLERQMKVRVRNSIIVEIESACTDVATDTRRKIIKVIKNKIN